MVDSAVPLEVHPSVTFHLRLQRGEIACIEEGDIIRIDIPNNSINIDVSEEEIKRRMSNWKPKPPNVEKGWLARYARMVSSANTGAVML